MLGCELEQSQKHDEHLTPSLSLAVQPSATSNLHLPLPWGNLEQYSKLELEKSLGE